jgi:hypothetical protein
MAARSLLRAQAGQELGTAAAPSRRTTGRVSSESAVGGTADDLP